LKNETLDTKGRGTKRQDKVVRQILLARSFGATDRQGLELGESAKALKRQPSADKS